MTKFFSNRWSITPTGSSFLSPSPKRSISPPFSPRQKSLCSSPSPSNRLCREGANHALFPHRSVIIAALPLTACLQPHFTHLKLEPCRCFLHTHLDFCCVSYDGCFFACRPGLQLR